MHLFFLAVFFHIIVVGEEIRLVRKFLSGDSPPLSVPVFSTVGVHHPAQVWAQQRPSRVQQRLHHGWRTAVHSYRDQLCASVGHLHCICEGAAV